MKARLVFDLTDMDDLYDFKLAQKAKSFMGGAAELREHIRSKLKSSSEVEFKIYQDLHDEFLKCFDEVKDYI